MRLGFGLTVWFNSLNNRKPDGIAVYTQEIWKVLQKEKDITLVPLTFNKVPSSAKLECSANISKGFLKFSIHTILHRIFNIPFTELSLYEKKIDLFFAPDHHIPLMKNVPVIATVMDIIPLVHPEWVRSSFRKIKINLFKRSILGADHIITISNYSKKDLIDHLNIPSDKISVVDLGVNKRFFKKVSDTEKKYVLDKYYLVKDFFIFIGTLQPRKNVIRIIKAHHELPKEVKKNHPLVIVGQYGWNSEDLMNEINMMTQKKEGIWLSYVEQDELYALLQSAICIVYPSLYEGFGLPVIEGFASECPVITSNITSLPEVAGNAALLVDPYSTEDIKNAMLRIVKDDDLRKKLISNGNEQVKKYSWDKVAKRHLKIFNEIQKNYE